MSKKEVPNLTPTHGGIKQTSGVHYVLGVYMWDLLKYQ